MDIRRTLLAAALAAFAFTAMPAMASAYEVDYENPEFTLEAGEIKLTAGGSTVSCNSAAGTGEFENGKTALFEGLIFGCKSAGTNCTSAGQSSGTVALTPLSRHIGSSSGKPVAVITANEGHIATFTCAFGLVKVEISGNGLIGEITGPGINEPSNGIEGKFETIEGKQALTEADLGEGSETFGLEITIGAGEPEPVGIDCVGHGTFIEGEGQITE